MQAKIVIQRHVMPGQEAQSLDLVVEMRSLATRQAGYISGETLIDTRDHSTIIVMSTWRSVQDWKRWERHPDRIRLEGMLAPLLESTPQVRVCADAGELRVEGEGASGQFLI